MNDGGGLGTYLIPSWGIRASGSVHSYNKEIGDVVVNSTTFVFFSCFNFLQLGVVINGAWKESQSATNRSSHPWDRPQGRSTAGISRLTQTQERNVETHSKHAFNDRVHELPMAQEESAKMCIRWGMDQKRVHTETEERE